MTERITEDEEPKFDKDINMENGESNETDSLGKKKIFLLILFILLLVIIIIILLIIFVFGNKCQKGDEEKCLTCNKNKCGSCNKGYKLENGECLINHSFRAVYHTNTENQTIDLINFPLDIISEMILDNENIEKSKNFTFKSKGDHKLYVLLNESYSLNDMFSGMKNMISISFTKLFNTEKKENLSNMFKDCLSLKSLDISGFKTEDVKNMNGLFSGCSSLESISLSNFDTKNVENMSNMFYGCSNLLTLDLSNFIPNNALDMKHMFYGCSNLYSLDLSNFKTLSVLNMSIYIFFLIYLYENGDLIRYFSSLNFCYYLSYLEIHFCLIN